VVGFGLIDPVAALTWDVPPGNWLSPGVQMQPLHLPPPPPAPDPRPRWGAVIVTAVAASLVGALAWILTVSRKRRQM